MGVEKSAHRRRNMWVQCWASYFQKVTSSDLAHWIGQNKSWIRWWLSPETLLLKLSVGNQSKLWNSIEFHTKSKLWKLKLSNIYGIVFWSIKLSAELSMAEFTNEDEHGHGIISMSLSVSRSFSCLCPCPFCVHSKSILCPLGVHSLSVSMSIFMSMSMSKYTSMSALLKSKTVYNR